MAIRVGDRVFNRGSRNRGIVLSEPIAGALDVRTEGDRVQIWPLADTVLDEPGATDPAQPGRGHITDPHDSPLKGQTGRT